MDVAWSNFKDLYMKYSEFLLISCIIYYCLTAPKHRFSNSGLQVHYVYLELKLIEEIINLAKIIFRFDF